MAGFRPPDDLERKEISENIDKLANGATDLPDKKKEYKNKNIHYGEAQLVSADENADRRDDLFAQARIDRTTSRDKAVETLRTIMGGGDSSPEEQQAAAQEAAAMTSLIEKESKVENCFRVGLSIQPELIIGKPYSGIVKDALMVTGLKADELAMCGDRLYTDIATGVNFGMTSILVMSGETTWEDREKSEIKPHLTFDRLASMIPYMEKI